MRSRQRSLASVCSGVRHDDLARVSHLGVSCVQADLVAREDKLPWLFVSERGCQMVRRAVNHMIAAAGKRAGLGNVHPHMLRHSCGYALANKGQDFRLIQDWLGHRDPKHTSRYTRVAARRFERVWD